MSNKIDIWSKGEVANEIVSLAEAGQVKRCLHLMLEHGHTQAYYPVCKKDWASRESARNVPLDVTAYNGPSSYSWPRCPDNCPHYTESSDNFLVSVSRDQYDEGTTFLSSDNYDSEPRPSSNDASKNEMDNVDTPIRPEKITISWLIKHVPVSFWITSICILFAIFVAGIEASQLTLIQELFGF